MTRLGTKVRSASSSTITVLPSQTVEPKMGRKRPQPHTWRDMRLYLDGARFTRHHLLWERQLRVRHGRQARAVQGTRARAGSHAKPEMGCPHPCLLP